MYFNGLLNCVLMGTERCNYLNRKNGFKRQGSLRDYPFKKRKLYDYSSVSNSDESINGNGICRTSENGINGSGPAQPGGNLPSFLPSVSHACTHIQSLHSSGYTILIFWILAI